MNQNGAKSQILVGKISCKQFLHATIVANSSYLSIERALLAMDAGKWDEMLLGTWRK
jgi:hypothetical protein